MGKRGVAEWIHQPKINQILVSFSVPKTPKQVEKEVCVRKLKMKPFVGKRLVRCLNPEARKGRLYMLTNKARKLLKLSNCKKVINKDWDLIGWIMASPKQRLVILKKVDSVKRISEKIRKRASQLNPHLSRISTKGILKELISKDLIETEMIKSIRKHIRPEAKIILHSCGSVHYAIQDFIEIGVNVLNPLQPLAHNMEPWRLKRDFGGKIAFMGGFDTQSLLPLGTVVEVKEGVKKLIQEYGSGGGLIFATAHNINPDCPPENIVAMFDEAYKYGKYPIPKPTGQSYVDYIRGLNLH